MSIDKYVNIITKQVKNTGLFRNIHAPDYMQIDEAPKLSPFDSAFKAATDSGQDVFDFGGKKFNTMQKGESDAQWKARLGKKAPTPVEKSPVVKVKQAYAAADRKKIEANAPKPATMSPQIAASRKTYDRPDLNTGAGAKFGQADTSKKVVSRPDLNTGAGAKFGQVDNSGKRVSYSQDKQSGAGGKFSQADTRQAAAQRTVGSTFDALAAKDRGSNMTTSAASIAAQRLAAKKFAAQKKTISDVPKDSYQPETRAAQLSRIDNLDSEIAKRRDEREKRAAAKK